MFALLKNISSPLFSLAFLMISVGLFSTFVPLRLTLDGIGPFIVGAVTSSYFAGQVIGSLRAERLINKVGYIRAFAALASLMSCVSAAMGILLHPFFWMLFRFLMGFFTAGLYVIIQSWLLMIGGKEKRGTILSFYMISFYSAQAGGQFVLNLASPLTAVPFAVGSFLSSLAVLPVTLSARPSPPVGERSRLSPLQLFRISAFGVSTAFTSGLIMGSFFGLTPVFANAIGMKTSEVATFMGMTIIGGFLLQWPLGRLSDRLNRRGVLIGVCFITSLISLLMVLASFLSKDILVILSVLFGVFAITVYPLSISYTNDFLDSRDLVAATGGLLLSYGMGCVVGPLIAPLLMKVFGPAGLYVYLSIVSSGIACIGMIKKRRRVSVSEQVKHRAIPQLTEVNPQILEEPFLSEPVEETVSSDERLGIES